MLGEVLLHDGQEIGIEQAVETGIRRGRDRKLCARASARLEVQDDAGSNSRMERNDSARGRHLPIGGDGCQRHGRLHTVACGDVAALCGSSLRREGVAALDERYRQHRRTRLTRDEGKRRRAERQFVLDCEVLAGKGILSPRRERYLCLQGAVFVRVSENLIERVDGIGGNDIPAADCVAFGHLRQELVFGRRGKLSAAMDPGRGCLIFIPWLRALGLYWIGARSRRGFSCKMPL